MGDSKNMIGLVQFAFVTILRSNPIWSGVWDTSALWMVVSQGSALSRFSRLSFHEADLRSWRSRKRSRSKLYYDTKVGAELGWQFRCAVLRTRERGAEPKLHCTKMWCMSCNHPELNCCSGRSVGPWFGAQRPAAPFLNPVFFAMPLPPA